MAVVRARSCGRCEARLPECRGRATEFHHVKSRARGGSDNPINILYVCHHCHHLVTIHAPGTEPYRTHSWQPEGRTEADWAAEDVP